MLNIPIQTIRSQKVILDSDLAKLYEVTTKRLNEQVKRNERKFPTSFRFQITKEEHEMYLLQIPWRCIKQSAHEGKLYAQ